MNNKKYIVKLTFGKGSCDTSIGYLAISDEVDEISDGSCSNYRIHSVADIREAEIFDTRQLAKFAIMLSRVHAVPEIEEIKVDF